MREPRRQIVACGRFGVAENHLSCFGEQVQTAVQLQPNSEEAVTYLAYLYNDEGDTTRALQVLESVPEAQRSAKLYAANKSKDRDKDGVACET